MTIDKNDDADLRNDVNNIPINVVEGFKDPTKSYPKSDYIGSPSTNKAMTGGKINDINLGGGLDNIDIDLPPLVPTQFPYNDVKETPAGHIFELNDTPGGERILIKHASGAGFDIRPDGTLIAKANGNMITIVDGSQSVIVEGDVNINYLGNVNMKIGGDFNLEIDGNVTKSYAGNVKEDIMGSSRSMVSGTRSETSKESKSEIVIGTKTSTTIGDVNNIVKGIVKNTIQGDQYSSVSGTYKISSSDELVLSSNNMNISSHDISVFGATGTIGGAGVVNYSKTSYATSFYGDLVGTAQFAERADVTNSQGYSEGSTGSSSGYTVADDGSATVNPTSNLVKEYLEKSENGIVQVIVDDGDFIKNMIDRTEDNAGLSRNTLTTADVRSKLKDPSNMENQKFITTQIQQGTLSNKYSQTIPKEIGRLSSASPSVTTPTNPLSSLSRVSRIKSQKNMNVKRFIPSTKIGDDVSGQTKLNDCIKLSRFLGGNQTKGLLNQIATIEEKQTIARHCTMHANVMKRILKNKSQFANHRLVVAHGVYVLEPQEKITYGTINEFASQGRAITYELHDAHGNVDFSKTFDLAKFWKDNEIFDLLILDYDNYNPSGEMNVQLILVVPELDENYNFVDGKYANKIETRFNNNVQGNELIEILSA